MFTQCHLSGRANLGAVCSPNGLNTFSNMQMEYLKLFGTLCFYSKYLAPNIYIRVEYPRYDVNYLKILLGSLYPNVIQIFALKYIKISPSLPTWKFVSECYTNNCFKIYKNISFIANLEVCIRMLYKYLL